MRVAVDTNAYAEAARGQVRTAELLRGASEIFLPFVVLGELRAGFSVGRRGARNEAGLTMFLQSPRVQTLFADEQTTAHYARLYAFLRKNGTPVPTNDLWIAALVVQHDLALMSSDRHFDNLPQLVRVS